MELPGLGLPNNGHGYWVVGDGLQFQTYYGPFTDYEAAERCLIAVAGRSDVIRAVIQSGYGPPTPTAEPPVTAPNSSQEGSRRATTSRR